MKNFKIHRLLFYLFVLFISTCNPVSTIPVAKEGVLDLREWDIINEKVNLDGEWDFYWNELSARNSFTFNPNNRSTVNVPGIWNKEQILRTLQDGTKIKESVDGIGYSTYHLKILLKEKLPLALRTSSQGTAFYLYVDGIKLLSSGVVGTDEESSKPNKKSIFYIDINPEKDTIDLVLEVSNFHNKNGGIWYSLSLGGRDVIQETKDSKLAIDLFITGILSIMGAYHISLFMLLRKDKSSLYFGSISIVLAIRTLLTGEHYLYTILPYLSYTLGLKIEYLTLYLGTPLFLEFVFKLYYFKILNYLRKILLGVCIFLSLLILITPPIIFTRTLPLMQFILVLTIFIIIGVIIYSIKVNKDGARVFLLGFFIFSIIIINDLLHNNHIINTGYYSSFGLVIFIFSQAYILTSRFSGAFHKIEDLSKNLEKKVEERTLNLENEVHKSNVLNRMISVVIQSNSNREILNNIYELLHQRYNLDSFLLYMLNESKDKLVYYSKYGKVQFPKEVVESIKKIEINKNEEGSVHFICVRKKRSIFSKNIKIPHPSKKEDEIISLLGVKSIYIIPLIVENEVIGTIDFSENNFEGSGLQKLKTEDRKDIENFIKLISPSIRQAYQKTLIEEAYSDLKLTQKKLLEAERISSLGQLVGGVAHEINNPISVIRSNSSIMKKNIESFYVKVPTFFESLNPIEKEIFYQIIGNFLLTKKSISSKEERTQKKQIEKELITISQKEEESYQLIAEHIISSHIQPFYKDYLSKIEFESFRKILEMAHLFTHQINLVRNVEIAVDKASRVVFSLRCYLNVDTYSEKKVVNLEEQINRVLQIYDNYIIGKINISFHSSQIFHINCIADNLFQVWNNLIFNSIQAMFETNKNLEIEIYQSKKLPDDFSSYKCSTSIESIQTLDPKKDWVTIHIKDTGIGIIDELQEKIFSPFFTTKKLGEGIGLGLFVCKKIIEDHGGFILFKSDNHNTEFVVVLPLS